MFFIVNVRVISLGTFPTLKWNHVLYLFSLGVPAQSGEINSSYYTKKKNFGGDSNLGFLHEMGRFFELYLGYRNRNRN